MSNSAEILIVDDIPEHITFASSILKSEGYKIYAVINGKSALEFLKTKHPDLIMLDIKMDDLNGLEVCERIKKDEKTNDIPIIFLTAETNSKVIRQGFEIGCCDYITKPFIREEFLARVKTHLNISRQSHELTIAYNELNLFCSAVSHDLKAPLNVINMLIEMLQSEVQENSSNIDEVINITNMISEKSSQLITMIERLLEFSKMCNIKPKFEIVNITNIVTKVFNELKLTEPTRNIKLIYNTLPSILGDEVLISMLIKNLISNAFKFTRNQPKAIIEVSSYPYNDYIAISIKDNGAGFDMNYANKLFKIFQRLHPNTEYEGTGVGLALVDRIIKRHGGKIEAFGKVNQGAEFVIYFLRNP